MDRKSRLAGLHGDYRTGDSLERTFRDSMLALLARSGAPEHQHFDLRFLWRADEGAAVKSAESLEVAWVPLDDLEARFDSPSMARVTRKLAALGRTP